MAVDETAAMQS